jgi:hypothetical protein
MLLSKEEARSHQPKLILGFQAKHDYSKDLHDYSLHYCNHQADQMFQTNLGQVNKTDLQASEYLIM